jgi:hypothetical protein
MISHYEDILYKMALITKICYKEVQIFAAVLRCNDYNL